MVILPEKPSALPSVSLSLESSGRDTDCGPQACHTHLWAFKGFFTKIHYLENFESPTFYKYKPIDAENPTLLMYEMCTVFGCHYMDKRNKFWKCNLLKKNVCSPHFKPACNNEALWWQYNRTLQHRDCVQNVIVYWMNTWKVVLCFNEIY